MINDETKKYITKKLTETYPYIVSLLDTTFVIPNPQVYAPGKLTAMFAKYLLDNDLARDKRILDLGCGCFAVGIILAKAGAKEVIGVDIVEDAVQCAKQNAIANRVEHSTKVLMGNGVEPVLTDYQGKFDLIIAGAPWETLSQDAFQKINADERAMYRAFFDVEDQLITSLFIHAAKLLAPKGKIFLTSSSRVIERLRSLCQRYQYSYEIVEAKDLHAEGEEEYVVRLFR